jgi:hypothetical protein
VPRVSPRTHIHMLRPRRGLCTCPHPHPIPAWCVHPARVLTRSGGARRAVGAAGHRPGAGRGARGGRREARPQRTAGSQEAAAVRPRAPRPVFYPERGRRPRVPAGHLHIGRPPPAASRAWGPAPRTMRSRTHRGRGPCRASRGHYVRRLGCWGCGGASPGSPAPRFSSAARKGRRLQRGRNWKGFRARDAQSFPMSSLLPPSPRPLPHSDPPGPRGITWSRVPEARARETVLTRGKQRNRFTDVWERTPGERSGCSPGPVGRSLPLIAQETPTSPHPPSQLPCVSWGVKAARIGFKE